MPRRVLVGYDHSEEAASGLRRGAAIASSERAELTVVHVVVPPPTWVGIGLLAVPMFDDLVATAETLVRQAVDELPQDICVRWRLITGAEASSALSRHRCVREALRRALDEGGHDLLVLGTGMRPGRVARALLKRCPGRVLASPFADPDAPAVLGGAPLRAPRIVS